MGDFGEASLLGAMFLVAFWLVVGPYILLFWLGRKAMQKLNWI